MSRYIFEKKAGDPTVSVFWVEGDKPFLEFVIDSKIDMINQKIGIFFVSPIRGEHKPDGLVNQFVHTLNFFSGEPLAKWLPFWFTINELEEINEIIEIRKFLGL